MRIVVVSFAAVLVSGCLSMQTPRTVNLQDIHGECTGSIEPENAPGKVCTDQSDEWKQIKVRVVSPPFNSSHATLWVAPGSRCSTNSIPVDIREIESCQRFGYKLE